MWPIDNVICTVFDYVFMTHLYLCDVRENYGLEVRNSFSQDVDCIVGGAV